MMVSMEKIIDKYNRDWRVFMVIFFKFRGYVIGVVVNGIVVMIVENLNWFWVLLRVVVM